jgi:hypothetical protein
MAAIEPTLDSRLDTLRDPHLNQVGTVVSPGKSVVSWPAIIAGAFVAAAASLILLALGSGLGFASISPWPGHGVSETTFNVTAAIWLIVTQWISAALGGYIAGRLRTRWHGTHTHEIFFRDTAHGLITWAVATVIIAAGLASSVSSFLGGGMRADIADPRSAMSAGPSSTGYDMFELFRPAAPGAAAQGAGDAGAAASGDPRGVADDIAANAIATGSVSDADRSYLAALVAAQTGIAPADAQRRVGDFIAATMNAEIKARAAADGARKAAAEAAILTALSMLIGAFIACVSAALGGRLRDEHP